MNKFELINTVLQSTLKAEDKCLLIELIVRADENGECWPSVERLCKVRGIRHEKNFKGADYYLPGLVTKRKRGRKNIYTINTPAVEGLSAATVSIKHTNTPAVEGSYTPAVADNTPAVEGLNSPAVEGANSTVDTSKETTEDNTLSASAPVDISLNVDSPDSSLKEDTPRSSLIDTTDAHTPATEGLFSESHQRELNDSLDAIASDRQWEPEFTEQVRHLILDPTFNTEVQMPGSRIAVAESKVKYAENVW